MTVTLCRVIFNVTETVSLICQVHQHVLADQGEALLDQLIASISNNRQTLENAVPTKDLDKLWARINGVSSRTQCCVSLTNKPMLGCSLFLLQNMFLALVLSNLNQSG